MSSGGSYTQRGGQHPGTTYNGREPSRQYPMWKCSGCPMENYADCNFCYRCRTVSYTHLDVYKRQVLDMAREVESF